MGRFSSMTAMIIIELTKNHQQSNFFFFENTVIIYVIEFSIF